MVFSFRFVIVDFEVYVYVVVSSFKLCFKKREEMMGVCSNSVVWGGIEFIVNVVKGSNSVVCS